MAHNLNEVNGKTNMMYVGKEPWHGLGTKLNNPATSKEAIVAAGLDYAVAKEYLYIGNGKAEGRHIGDFRAVVRQDTKDVLGIATDRYSIVQNTECFDFFDEVVGDKLAMYHTAGALGKGERIWMLAKLPNSVLVTKDDVVEKYLLLTNSHDGSSSLKMYFTPVRVVCQNTLIMSYANARDGISIRHTGSVASKINEARKVLGLAVNYYMQFDKDAHALVKYKMNERELKLYFDFVLKGDKATETEESAQFKNQRDELFSLFTGGKGNNLPQVRGSAWAAYNAVTEHIDWHKTVKGAKEDQTNRLKSIWFGSGAVIKARAYAKAMDMIKVAV